MIAEELSIKEDEEIKEDFTEIRLNRDSLVTDNNLSYNTKLNESQLILANICQIFTHSSDILEQLLYLQLLCICAHVYLLDHSNGPQALTNQICLLNQAFSF